MHTHSSTIDPGRTLRPWELALLLAVCVTLLTGTWAQARSALLASRLVRLHVIAVSDDDTEQAVKLQVRDAVLAYLEPQLAGVTDMDTARGTTGGASFSRRCARRRQGSRSERCRRSRMTMCASSRSPAAAMSCASGCWSCGTRSCSG